VIVLDGGKVVHVGRHDELMRSSGYFRTLATAWFKDPGGAEESPG
jgi:ABC-type multidrug transport system fused ATPase/permease subunit